MLPYISTKIQDSFKILGIITVFKRKFSGTASGGESHDFPELLFIEHGSYTLLLDGEEKKLSAGDLIVYAPRAFHGAEGVLENADVYILSFEVEGAGLDSVYNKIFHLDLGQIETLRKIVDEAKECFTRRPTGTGFHGMTLNEGVSEYTLEKIKKQLEFFLLDIRDNEIAGGRKDYENDILRVKLFCLQNLDKTLSLNDIARGSSMSVSKLKLLFRENYGGALNFFNELKIEEAKRKILDGKQNFTEIADSLGFSSLHYFSRLFKKKAGLSPSEYKKKCNQKG